MHGLLHVFTRLMEDADERPHRVELLLEVCAYLAALVIVIVGFVMMDDQNTPAGEQVAFGVVYVMVPVVCWLLGKPRLGGRIQLLGMFLAAAFLMPRPLPAPDLATMKKDGLALADELDRFRKAHKTYPASLEELKPHMAAAPLLRWEYKRLAPDHFQLWLSNGKEPGGYLLRWDSVNGVWEEEGKKRPKGIPPNAEASPSAAKP